MRLCTYEDRAENLIGIKLLARSLARHTPQAHLQITCPVADEAFTTWCGKQQNITLLNRAAPTHNGWDVKPALLQGLLDDGCG
ncbi:MAG: nucleotide-diphospho-sugar transferase, partial [Firmicutes bacterium]|nr:nucleotide-diphospho-sugar transferase [Bacillota bacterium]